MIEFLYDFFRPSGMDWLTRVGALIVAVGVALILFAVGTWVDAAGGYWTKAIPATVLDHRYDAPSDSYITTYYPDGNGGMYPMTTYSQEPAHWYLVVSVQGAPTKAETVQGYYQMVGNGETVWVYERRGWFTHASHGWQTTN